MGRIPENIVKNELPTLMNTIIDNGIEHPQILFGAINDHHCMAYCDAPIQIGQFESATDKLDTWLTSVAIQGGGEAPEDVTDKQLLEEAQRLYNVYHIHVNEASYKDDPQVLGYWKDMLGERLIVLNDYSAICATIATLIAVQHGVDINDGTSKLDDNMKGLVTSALATVTTGSVVSKNDDGVIEL